MVPNDATYVVHLDQDTALFRDPRSKIVDKYLDWLDQGYAYVCQPFNGGDPMWHASTRFFICKKGTLDLDEAEKIVNDRNHVPFCPAFEFVLGAMTGKGRVLYPEPKLDEYMVISWSRYYKGLLKKLAAMPYPEISKLIQSWGIHGPNDVEAQEL